MGGKLAPIHRRWDRSLPKSALARSAEILWRDREVFRLTEARRWKRRFIWAVIGAFLAGAAASVGVLCWIGA